MAIIAHTPYTGNTDCKHSNFYIVDGHGLEASRSNRYISDGHGKSTLLGAYNCPADPALATEFMLTLRRNYEYQHPVGKNRTKGSVVHQQLYVSLSESEPVPEEERMEIMRELIERTELRHFASIYSPHSNTSIMHGHISICPYSLPDETGKTHKLCMNNALLYSLRRELDHICVEHGLSIVECPELFGDKAYRDWFQQVKESGTVGIHPPKEQEDHTPFQQGRKRARRYAASKQSQALRREKQAEYYRYLTRSYNKESAHLFYSPAHLYNPNDPARILHIRTRDKTGRELSELEQSSVALFVWSYQAARVLEKRKIAGSDGLRKRLQTLADKAVATQKFISSMDIRTQAELITHIKECGSDIAELKRDIARQNAVLTRLTDVMDAIDRWENQRDPDARIWLEEHHCAAEQEIAAAQKKYARAMGRKVSGEDLLEERKREYRHLKEAESLLHPASNAAEWQEYLESVFSKEIAKKIGWADADKLTRQLHQMGKTIGILPEDVDRLVDAAKKTAGAATWAEHRAFLHMASSSDPDGSISAKYDEIRNQYHQIRELHRLVDDMPLVGPLTFLLGLLIACYAGAKEAVTMHEIEQLQWEATVQKEYARKFRYARQQALHDEKAVYDREIIGASEEEILASKIRFYEKAAIITNRYDILLEIRELQQFHALDSIIEEAVQRRLGTQELYRSYVYQAPER